ncbi:MarR family winged helix-turn-helix transcriptional regulator [Ghiorsea bivora]|uniref:MarR family winged helix-turn-helix transcriptional regulator n=1 Tax=Ghiorsea bivora TaxID=1485545 RepID=UPI0012FD7D0D|nr:MarR family transcriptional regulator [Ghiorsea bivora]
MPLIGQLMCFMRQQTSQAYKDLGYDITPEAAQALMIIQHFEGLTQTKLAHILEKDKASVTRLLNSLVQFNLVERIQDHEDRRIIRAHITPKGQNIFEQFIPKLHALSDMTLQGISDTEFTQMINTLNQITNNINAPYCDK